MAERCLRKSKKRDYRELAGLKTNCVEEDIFVPTDDYYKVDRIVKARRKGKEYLVLWEGYGKEDAQWVHASNITNEAIRAYEHPEPSKSLIQDNVVNFIHAVDKSLNLGTDRDNTIRFHFRHDVYRFLFRDSTELNVEDFYSTYFTPGWDQCCRQYKGVTNTVYTGCRIRFPLTVTLYLDWTKPERFYRDDNYGTVVKKKRTFVEMIKININKNDY